MVHLRSSVPDLCYRIKSLEVGRNKSSKSWGFIKNEPQSEVDLAVLLQTLISFHCKLWRITKQFVACA